MVDIKFVDTDRKLVDVDIDYVTISTVDMIEAGTVVRLSHSFGSKAFFVAYMNDGGIGRVTFTSLDPNEYLVILPMRRKKMVK